MRMRHPFLRQNSSASRQTRSRSTMDSTVDGLPKATSAVTACCPFGVCLKLGSDLRQRQRAAARAMFDRLRPERIFALASPPDLPAFCLLVTLLSIHRKQESKNDSRNTLSKRREAPALSPFCPVSFCPVSCRLLPCPLSPSALSPSALSPVAFYRFRLTSSTSPSSCVREARRRHRPRRRRSTCSCRSRGRPCRRT